MKPRFGLICYLFRHKVFDNCTNNIVLVVTGDVLHGVGEDVVLDLLVELLGLDVYPDLVV